MSNSATPNIASLSLASASQSRCCWYCGRGEETLPTKLQKCTRCRLAVYCNRECQRGDWKLHKAKCKKLTEIVVDTDVKNRLQSGALKRRLLTLSEGTVILTIRDKDIITIGDMNLALERVREAPFIDCKSLLRVDLKGCAKLTSVGRWVFGQCTSLTSVVLPDSLTKLGEGVFTRCHSLTSVVLPDYLTQLGDSAFFECISLASVVFPDSLTQIALQAFQECTSLTSVVLPDSLTQLGESAFGGCSSLTSLVLPDSLTQLGDGAFGGCSSLTSVVMPDSLTQMGRQAFQQCTSLTSVVLPDSLTLLGGEAFQKCTSLTSVVLPDSLTEIGKWAFSVCSSLTSVVFPESLTQISKQAFQECSSLMSVVFPDSLTMLGLGAFALCTSLTSVLLPDSLTQIDSFAFVECSSLTSVVMPDRAELGEHVFMDCNALLQKAALAGFDLVELYLRDRYKCITLRKLVLRLLRKYNQAVNNADGTEAEKHATALAQLPANNYGSLEVGLFLQKMNISGGDGVIGLVGYILKFV